MRDAVRDALGDRPQAFIAHHTGRAVKPQTVSKFFRDKRTMEIGQWILMATAVDLDPFDYVAEDALRAPAWEMPRELADWLRTTHDRRLVERMLIRFKQLAEESASEN